MAEGERSRGCPEEADDVGLAAAGQDLSLVARISLNGTDLPFG